MDAAVEWGNGKVYFFRGAEYVRYDSASQSVDAGYPRPIAGNWPGLWDRDIDAAVNWGNGKVYFFRGDQYVRYDVAADRVDDGYPKTIRNHWPGLWDRDIDAAVNWWNYKVYFFKGREYVRYDVLADRVEDGYPRPIAGAWPGLFDSDIDAGVNWGDGKTYFFKSTEYVRYDYAADRGDLGPAPIPAAFTNLSAAAAPRAVAWGTKVSEDFRRRLHEICADLAVEPSFLMAAMAFETGRTFDPAIRNRHSGATGLIQFMPSTATSLGTSTDELARMTAEQQLEYVAKYFAPYKKKLRTLADVYMTILWPAAVGKPAEHVLFAKPGKAYEQNAGLDYDRDGSVMKYEAERKVRPLLAEGLRLAG